MSKSRSEDDEVDVFRPGWLWRASSSAAGGVLAALMLWIVVREPISIVWIVAVPSVVLGGLAAVRSWLADVSFDRDELTVRGVLWSRRVRRDQIIGVDTDGYSPYVYWRSTSGRMRMTPLTVLTRGSTILPASLFSRGDAFLQRLSSWAEGRGEAGQQ